MLDWLLVVERVGGSSVTLRLEMASGGQQRMTARLVLVWMSPEGRPARWPDRIRAVLAAHQEGVA